MRNIFRRAGDASGVPDPSPAARPYAHLARHLEVLGSETRLALLHVLRRPRALSEIRAMPTLSREGENPDRALSRQAVTHQLEVLMQAGLVHRTRPPGMRGDLYVLNHERLFGLIDELRSLAKLRALPGAEPEPGDTFEHRPGLEAELRQGPRLVVAYGRDDGVAYGLPGEPGARIRIGRAAPCEVRLDYDPYLSAEHAFVEATPAGHLVVDAGSRNGTLVNFRRLGPRAAHPLKAGDILSVGRTNLVFQT